MHSLSELQFLPTRLAARYSHRRWVADCQLSVIRESEGTVFIYKGALLVSSTSRPCRTWSKTRFAAYLTTFWL